MIRKTFTKFMNDIIYGESWNHSEMVESIKSEASNYFIENACKRLGSESIEVKHGGLNY